MSTLQIDLDGQTLKRLRQISRREKRPIGDVAAHLLADAVRAVRLGPADDAAEAELLRQINTGWAAERWQRYHALVVQRRAGCLTPEEHRELIALTDEREMAHAQRLEHLIALAQLRQTTLDALMEQLGLQAPGYVWATALCPCQTGSHPAGAGVLRVLPEPHAVLPGPVCGRTHRPPRGRRRQ